MERDHAFSPAGIGVIVMMAGDYRSRIGVFFRV